MVHSIFTKGEADEVLLCGIEGAIVLTIDAAQSLVYEKIASIKSVETSSVPLESRTTSVIKIRSKIAIKLKNALVEQT
jgi:hypothetical protein